MALVHYMQTAFPLFHICMRQILFPSILLQFLGSVFFQRKKKMYPLSPPAKLGFLYSPSCLNSLHAAEDSSTLSRQPCGLIWLHGIFMAFTSYKQHWLSHHRWFGNSYGLTFAGGPRWDLYPYPPGFWTTRACRVLLWTVLDSAVHEL